MKIYNCEQKSEAWALIRADKFTGTDAHALETPVKRATLMATLLASKLSNDPADDESDMARGNRLEPEARKVYEQITGYTVKEIGFAQKDEWVGDSPDGVIEIEDKIKRVLEIKCLSDKKHVEILLSKKVPKEYRNQCIHKFIVYRDADAVDFFAYNPRISIKPHILVTLNREELKDEITEYEIEQNKFIEELKQKLIEILI